MAAFNPPSGTFENAVALFVSWFADHQRDLPWRRTYDPYHVWLSEIMLQQTQVETVVPYYERFLEEFPTITALAGAREERVMKLWAGLGYYRRAKHLMEAARVVMKEHKGNVPSEYDALIALPGVGQYVAGAILSIAFNKPYPVVDGNVRRVLSRIFGLTDDYQPTLWDAAARVVQFAEPRIVNQAMMELGARVCSFRLPRCLVCPLQTCCVAFRTGMQDRIPPVQKRPKIVHVRLFAIICRKKGLYLMRSSEGLWEFPMVSELPGGSYREIGSCRHTITHHRLHVTVYEGSFEKRNGYEWKNFQKAPVSSLTRKIFETQLPA